MLQLWWRCVRCMAESWGSQTVQATTADMQACWVYIWAEIRWQCLSHVSAVWKVQCDSLESRECCRCSDGGDLHRQQGSFFLLSPSAERNRICAPAENPSIKNKMCAFSKHTLNQGEALMAEADAGMYQKKMFIRLTDVFLVLVTISH